MPTFGDIATQLVAAESSMCGTETAALWCIQRYDQMLSKALFRHQRQYGQLYLPAPLNTGTITVTANSTLVTADATASPTWTQAQVGWWLRINPSRVWYRISQVNPSPTAATLVLETPVATDNQTVFAGTTTVSDLGYFIIQRFVPLDIRARFASTFILDYQDQPIDEYSQEGLNRKYPARYLIGPYPWCVSFLNTDLGLDGQPMMAEFYPWPTTSVTVHYLFYAYNNKDLNYDSTVPASIPDHVIREGARIDVLRWEAKAAAKRGNVELAAFYRNEARAQETVWNRVHIDDAARNDRGMDDITFVMQARMHRPNDYDPIQTAYDNVWFQEG